MQKVGQDNLRSLKKGLGECSFPLTCLRNPPRSIMPLMCTPCGSVNLRDELATQNPCAYHLLWELSGLSMGLTCMACSAEGTLEKGQKLVLEERVGSLTVAASSACLHFVLCI